MSIVSEVEGFENFAKVGSIHSYTTLIMPTFVLKKKIFTTALRKSKQRSN